MQSGPTLAARSYRCRRLTGVIWPDGFRAVPSIGGSIPCDASGALVARTGEIVRIEAVPLAPGGPLLVCGSALGLGFREGVP
jgi:hypothetical protein